MFRLFLLFNLISLSAFSKSEIYQTRENLKDTLGENMFEPNYFILLLGFLFVLLVCYIVSKVYQNFTKDDVNEASDIVNKIDVISSVELGKNKELYVIKLNGVYSLIGTSQNNIVHIKDFTNSDINNFLRNK